MSKNLNNINKNNELFPIEVKSVIPKNRSEVLNVNGWGFADSYFTSKDGKLIFAGDRYPLCHSPFKNARKRLMELLNVDIEGYKPNDSPVHRESDYPPAVQNPELCEELTQAEIDFSTNFDDRFVHCRGQAMKDLYILRFGKFKRVPDLVVWPKSHEDVLQIVNIAKKYCAVIIPYGGGTNTMMSLSYLKDENRRFFISLDTTQMNRILWIDPKSKLACIEGGIVGRDMEDALEKRGFTVGHEPDSIELSTLGGWVATKSGGMKQQKYGNIEDIVEKVTMVTCSGVLEKNYIAPRVSMGPNFEHLALGSEGTLGVITKVVVKLHEKPQVRRFGSIAFTDFESGINFMYEVSKFSKKPSSLRLIDNYHVRLGMAFVNHKTLFQSILTELKMLGLQHILGYDMMKFSLATYLIEGSSSEADEIEANMKASAKRNNGFNGGASYGEKSYLITYTNCYTRDLLFDVGFLFDSLEPSVSWDKCGSMINALRDTWNTEMNKRKILNGIAFRISQIYDTGVCVYFYYGIGPTTDKDQFETYEELTDILRKVIQGCGGSVSHHHGIGKKNIKYLPQAISDVGVEIYKSVKNQLDPNNIFDAGNLIDHKIIESKM